MHMSAPPYPGPPMAVYQAQPVPVQPVQMYTVQQPQLVQPVTVQPVQIYSVQQPRADDSVTVIVAPQLGASPGRTKCVYCQQTVVTRVMYKNGALTWLICGLLGIFIIWPCCLIPFCVNDCKDVEHSCPSCNATLHTYKRM